MGRVLLELQHHRSLVCSFSLRNDSDLEKALSSHLFLAVTLFPELPSLTALLTNHLTS